MGVFDGNERPVVVGHRGLRHPELEENTPAAFAAAHAAGAQWVELDVRRSADGRLVLYHDGWTPDGVPVVDRPAAALADHGLWTLERVLPALPEGMGVNVEVKNFPGEPDYDPEDAIVPIVCEVVADHVGTRPLLLSSFNPLTVAGLARGLPDVPAGLIHYSTVAVSMAVPMAVEQGAVAVCSRVEAKGLDPEGVAVAHRAGLEVMVWTVNDPEVARRLAAAGVQALCTDDPATIRDALEADAAEPASRGRTTP